MRYPKRSQYKSARSRYRVQNWAQYEAGLRMPGALTVWLSDTGLEAWRAPATGRPGGQRTCSDVAIEAVLDAQVPQTTAVRRDDHSLEGEYDGDPQWEAIPETSLEFAVNIGTPVIAGRRGYRETSR